jgi:hypothetical protein
MFTKRIINTNKQIIKYRFNKNDSVLCTAKDSKIKNAVVLSRYNISGINYYKISDNIDTKISKESELIHR